MLPQNRFYLDFSFAFSDLMPLPCQTKCQTFRLPRPIGLSTIPSTAILHKQISWKRDFSRHFLKAPPTFDLRTRVEMTATWAMQLGATFQTLPLDGASAFLMAADTPLQPSETKVTAFSFRILQ